MYFSDFSTSCQSTQIPIQISAISSNYSITLYVDDTQLYVPLKSDKSKVFSNLLVRLTDIMVNPCIYVVLLSKALLNVLLIQEFTLLAAM